MIAKSCQTCGAIIHTSHTLPHQISTDSGRAKAYSGHTEREAALGFEPGSSESSL